MKIRVETDRCVGAGQCVLAAPELFTQRDEDGVVVVLQEEPPPEFGAGAREASELCPAVAIFVEE